MNRSSSNPDPQQPDNGSTQKSSAAGEGSADHLKENPTRGIDEPTLELSLNRNSGVSQPSPDSPAQDQSQSAAKTLGPSSDATMTDETLTQDPMERGRAWDNPTDSETPTRLGRYQIEALLGRGGMGSVYRAHDTQLDRKVALKVPKFEAKTNSTLIDRFYREARSAANLAHPNLCPVFDVGEVDGTHYIAMALIKGDTLSNHIRNNAELPERFAAITVLKIARAMQEAHGSGIIHRDLKPANIMIDHRKEPIVMDFGLACPDELDDDSRLTQEGALLGSPAYMSPEQLRGAEDSIGQGSDVYALGVVLYEILSGRLPFAGNGSTISMIGQILTEEPTDLKSLRPSISTGLAEICVKAMAKSSSERYSSMESFGNDLERFIRNNAARKKTSTNDTKTAQAHVSQIQLNEQSKLARTLCESRQFAAAVPILQQIVDNPQAKNSKTQTWASATLQKVRARIEEDNRRQAAASETKAALTTNVENDLFADLPDAQPTNELRPSAPIHRVHQKIKQPDPTNSRNLIVAIVGTLMATLIGGGLWFWTQNRQTEPMLVTPPDPVDQNPDLANGGDQIGRARPQIANPADRFMQRFDKDRDGFITARELPRPDKSILMQIDSNDDGRVSRDEINNIDPIELLSLQSNRTGGNNFNRGQRPQGGPNGFENGRQGLGFNGSQPRDEVGPNRPFDGQGRPGPGPGRKPQNGLGPRGERPAGGPPFGGQGRPNQ